MHASIKHAKCHSTHASSSLSQHGSALCCSCAVRAVCAPHARTRVAIALPLSPSPPPAFASLSFAMAGAVAGVLRLLGGVLSLGVVVRGSGLAARFLCRVR